MNSLDFEVHRVLNHCDRVNLDVCRVFETAHLWRFNRQANMQSEVALFEKFGYVPPYVIKYLDHVDKYVKQQY
jgi:hypothetical protein